MWLGNVRTDGGIEPLALGIELNRPCGPMRSRPRSRSRGRAVGPKDLDLGLDLQRLRRGCVAERRADGWGLLAVSFQLLGKLASLRHDRLPFKPFEVPKAVEFS